MKFIFIFFVNSAIFSRGYLQFIWAVDWLLQPEAGSQVIGKLEYIHLLVRHLGQSDQLPVGHAQGPHVALGGIDPLLEGFQRQPLQRSILIVAQTVVVVWEEIAREGAIADLHIGLFVKAGRRCNKIKISARYYLLLLFILFK